MREVTLPDTDTTILRPIPFYVGLNKLGKVETSRKILTHGGTVVDHPGRHNTSNIISLIDTNAKARINGPVAYKVDYIQHCINAKTLLDLQPFRKLPVPAPGRKSGPQLLSRRKSIRRNAATVIESPVQHEEPVRDAPATAPEHIANPPSQTQPPEEDDGDAPMEEQPSQPYPTQPVAKRRAPSTPSTRSNLQVTEPIQVPSPNTTPSKMAPTSPTPNSKDTWSRREDTRLIELYTDAKAHLTRMGRDPSYILTLQFWNKVSKNPKNLPRGRTPRECCRRIEKLPLSLPTKGKRLNNKSKVVEEQGTSGTESLPIDEQQEEEVPDPNSPIGEKGNRGPSRKSTRSLGTPSPPIQKPGKKRKFQKAEQRVRKIIKHLAEKVGVSERRAFRALRNEKGSIRKARKVLKQGG